MDVLIETYYILLPVIATALIGWVGTLLKAQKKKEKEKEREIALKDAEAVRIRKANSTGIMLILRYMLKRYHAEYILQGAITYAQLEDWNEMFANYRDHEGNSIAISWNEEIQSLPRTDRIPSMSPYEAMLYKMSNEGGEKDDRK